MADVANNLGETPLHLVNQRDVRTVRKLLAAGAHAGRRDLKGQLPAARVPPGKIANMLEAAAVAATHAHPRKLP